MPPRVSHPTDVPMYTGLAQRVFIMGERLGNPVREPRRMRGYWSEFGRCTLIITGSSGAQGVPQRRQWRKKPAGWSPSSGDLYHLERDFRAAASDTKWVTDITSIRTAEHWLYLCVVLDMHSGLVVGWSMRPRQDRQLVVQAVLMELWQRPARTQVILHSDRGCQFSSEEYQRFLEAHQMICSMSAVGSCADNAAAESFFGVLKRERVN